MPVKDRSSVMEMRYVVERVAERAAREGEGWVGLGGRGRESMLGRGF